MPKYVDPSQFFILNSAMAPIRAIRPSSTGNRREVEMPDSGGAGFAGFVGFAGFAGFGGFGGLVVSGVDILYCLVPSCIIVGPSHPLLVPLRIQLRPLQFVGGVIVYETLVLRF